MKKDEEKGRNHQSERVGRGCLKPKNDVSFSAHDIDILNEVLNLVPELKVCAMAVHLHRKKGGAYPLAGPESVFDLFEGEELKIANHRITRELIHRYMQPGLFPISDDQSLIRAVYLGLSACNHDLNWALQAPPYADELLREIRGDLELITNELCQKKEVR